MAPADAPLPDPPIAPDPDAVIETLDAAKDENLLDSRRRGQTVHLDHTPADGQTLFMTGDLHDHRANFRKLLAAADLANHPERHLVLHELIHGDHVGPDGAEDSWRTLVAAAELKVDFPDRVHFLLANHDLAQIYGEGISKGGTDVCRAFNKGITRDFGGGTAAGLVQAAVTEFLLSLPLAVRCGNGLWLSHSLPREEEIDTFDTAVFDKLTPEPADYKRKTGPIYQLIWGRGVTPEGVGRFLDRVGAAFAVTGHQPQETGYLANGDRHLILASDHPRGAFCPIPLDHPPTMSDLRPRLCFFAQLDDLEADPNDDEPDENDAGPYVLNG